MSFSHIFCASMNYSSKYSKNYTYNCVYNYIICIIVHICECVFKVGIILKSLSYFTRGVARRLTTFSALQISIGFERGVTDRKKVVLSQSF